MPFAYYGAKHRLARHYPRPQCGTIVEPFAGSAGYACYWGHLADRVILVEKSSYVVDLWRRLQRMTADEVDRAVADALAEERTREPLVAFCGGSASIKALVNGRDFPVTPRMREDHRKGFPRTRVQRHLETIRGWEIVCGDYSDAPDLEATWFVDPPYQSLISSAGKLYAESSESLDYQELASWCESRRGQVLVCEQHPASWLPFQTFHRQINGSAVNQSMRLEVLWHRPITEMATQLELM